MNPDSEPGYRVVTGATLEALERDVGAYIGFNWHPQGSPFFDVGRNQWCQAMVKHKARPVAGDVALREPKRR